MPIDPALLEEEVGDEEDAEGELVDEFEVEGDLQPYEVGLSPVDDNSNGGRGADELGSDEWEWIPNGTYLASTTNANSRPILLASLLSPSSRTRDVNEEKTSDQKLDSALIKIKASSHTLELCPGQS